jgi:hypothetical protein
LRGDVEKRYRKYLEVIVQCHDIAMRLGYLLEDGNLVPDLGIIGLVVYTGADGPKKWIYHVFSALHELLVDHLASIVGSSLDVNGLLDDGVGAATKSLSSSILWTRSRKRLGSRNGKVRGWVDTWQGTVCVGGMMFWLSACGSDWNWDQARTGKVSGSIPEISYLVKCPFGRHVFLFRLTGRMVSDRVFVGW